MTIEEIDPEVAELCASVSHLFGGGGNEWEDEQEVLELARSITGRLKRTWRHVSEDEFDPSPEPDPDL